MQRRHAAYVYEKRPLHSHAHGGDNQSIGLFFNDRKTTMKSLLITLGLVAACMTTAAHSAPLGSDSTHFSSAQHSTFSAKAKHVSKHSKAKRQHRAAKKA